MKRADIVSRINQKMYEGLYHFDDIKHDLDDAIIAINNTLQAKFPMMSEVLVEDNSTYTYYDEETNLEAPYFPVKYIHSVVIEYVVSSLFRREGEFANEYNVAVGAFEKGLSAMFRDFYDHIPDQFIDDSSGVIAVNPNEHSREKEEQEAQDPPSYLDWWNEH